MINRQLTPKQKWEIVTKILLKHPELSDRALAKMAGLSRYAVGQARRELEEKGDLARNYTRTADSKGRQQRSEARQLGLKHYSTGRPCANGHICERRVVDGRCVTCVADTMRRWREANPANPEKERARGRLKRASNLEAHLAKERRFREANREKLNEKNARRHAIYRAAVKMFPELKEMSLGELARWVPRGTTRRPGGAA